MSIFALEYEEDAEKVFGIKAPDTNVITGELSEGGYSYVCRG